MRKDAESVVEDGSASSSLLSSSSALGRRKSSAGAQLDATRELRSSSKSNVAPKVIYRHKGQIIFTSHLTIISSRAPLNFVTD